MSLIAELKRRNVFKVGAAYLALAWVVVQATGAIVPALNLPATLVPTVVWIGVIGFPCVLIFAWVYELTPEGLKRESEVDRSQSITHVTSKRLEYLIIALMVVGIGLAVLQYVRPPAASTAVEAAATVPTPEAEPAAPASPAAVPEPAQAAPDEKSIAVLPFVNMSSDKEQEYFSDGMSEELLNLLAQAPDLKVIARTSSFAFKGKDTPIAEIAKTLGVAHVLEGSVRKSGNQVRITAQLIRTADSTHLWSESYDRPLDDIFTVQDEIANAIVQALQIKLAGGELSRRKGGTQNLEAYQLILRAGRAARQNTRSSLEASRKDLEQAIKLDPNYGAAWAWLAGSYHLQMLHGSLAPQEGVERMRQLAQHALQVSPDLAGAHVMLQHVHRHNWDWAAAEREAQQALAIDAMDAIALMATGQLSYTLGRWDDAERQLRAALVQDPLNPVVIWNLGFSYYLSGRFADSEGMYRKVFDLAPDFLWTRLALSKTLLAQGKVEAALAMAQGEGDEGRRLWLLPIILQAAGDQAAADEALKAQIAYLAETGAYGVAWTYAYRGDHDLALQWLDRAYQQKEPALVEIVGEPLFKNIAKDPRFIAFLKKMNLPTEPVPVNWQ